MYRVYLLYHYRCEQNMLYGVYTSWQAALACMLFLMLENRRWEIENKKQRIKDMLYTPSPGVEETLRESLDYFEAHKPCLTFGNRVPEFPISAGPFGVEIKRIDQIPYMVH